jgi:hypothetical protein
MKEQRRRTTADGSANSCAVVVGRWSEEEKTIGALWSRLGRASESLSASCFNSHLPQFKIENSKLKIPPAFLRPSLRGSSPFGLSEGPRFNDASRQPHAQLKTHNSKLITRNSKLWLAPPLLGNAGGVGPAAASK